MPVINWPEFPDPTGKVHRNGDGWVIMPTDYWLAVSRYVVDVEAGIEIVEAARSE